MKMNYTHGKMHVLLFAGALASLNCLPSELWSGEDSFATSVLKEQILLGCNHIAIMRGYVKAAKSRIVDRMQNIREMKNQLDCPPSDDDEFSRIIQFMDTIPDEEFGCKELISKSNSVDDLNELNTLKTKEYEDVLIALDQLHKEEDILSAKICQLDEEFIQEQEYKHRDIQESGPAIHRGRKYLLRQLFSDDFISDPRLRDFIQKYLRQAIHPEPKATNVRDTSASEPQITKDNPVKTSPVAPMSDSQIVETAKAQLTKILPDLGYIVGWSKEVEEECLKVFDETVESGRIVICDEDQAVAKRAEFSMDPSIIGCYKQIDDEIFVVLERSSDVNSLLASTFIHEFGHMYSYHNVSQIETTGEFYSVFLEVAATIIATGKGYFPKSAYMDVVNNLGAHGFEDLVTIDAVLSYDATSPAALSDYIEYRKNYYVYPERLEGFWAAKRSRLSSFLSAAFRSRISLERMFYSKLFDNAQNSLRYGNFPVYGLAALNSTRVLLDWFKTGHQPSLSDFIVDASGRNKNALQESILRGDEVFSTVIKSPTFPLEFVQKIERELGAK
jgi:hypothetical protein